MKTSIWAAAALMTAALALCTAVTLAQNVNHGESFELNSTLNANQSHEYTANSRINLNTGFLYEPVSHKHATMEIDPYGIYPPESGLTGGPNPGDTGVVGTLGGTVDVGTMGAAVYTIPIELPAGINGMQPSLAITYNSQAGNGLLGWGWDLAGLSSVERTGQTRYHDGAVGAVMLNDTTDRFMLDGKRLIAVADYTDSVEYKTEQDEWSRIMAYYGWFSSSGKENAGSILTISHFKVWKADGKTLEYGCTEDSRFTLQNSGPKALCWLINRITDRNGNSVVYHYNKNSTNGEYYISSIDYTEHSEEGTTIITPEFTIGFQYQSGNMQDHEFRYVEGNIVQNQKLLNHITVIRNINQTEQEKYSFIYQNDSLCAPYDMVRMHNRLEKVCLEKDGIALNPMRVIWSNDNNSNFFSTVEINDTAIYKNNPFVGDFNGDGYSDLAIVPHMDSVYIHNVDIKFYLNNPNSLGHFTPSTSMTVHDVDKRLDWLYPVDLNDDGIDDLVAYFYDSIVATGRDTTAIVIFENVGGNHFEGRDTIGIGNCRFLVRTGDFLGNGKTQLLLMPVLTNPLFSLTFSRLIYHDGNTLQKTSSNKIFYNVRDVAVGDFDGDGRTEILIVKDNGSTVYSLDVSNNRLTYHSCFNTNEINHSNRHNYVLTGDFNGDGKTDLLYNHLNDYNHQRWSFFYSTGVSFAGTGAASNLGFYEMPPFNLYTNSMRKFVDNIPANGFLSNGYHSVCTADFDGDGVCDVAGISMSPGYSASISIYSHFNPSINKFSSHFIGSNAPNPHYYFNCRSQYLHVGNFLGKENLSFLGLEYRGSSNIHNTPGVFSLIPSSELNSVKTVIDGIGNPVEFGYGYVQQPYQEFNHGVRRMPVPVRVVSSITTYNATDKRTIEHIGYSDPLYHRDGHGWLGFQRQTRKISKDGVVTDSIVSKRSLETMTAHAMLLPETDTIYVFPEEGTAVLLSATAYQFEKVRSSYGSLNTSRLVVCPALTEKTVVRYDPDNPGDVLSKTFVENRYNYSNGFYYHTYHCDSTMTGVGDYSSMGLSGCEFRSKEKTVFYSNDYATWTLNRPHVQTRTQSRTGKPDVVDGRWIEYHSTDSYLPSLITDVPGGVPSQNPLKVQTSFDYYPYGDLMRKTVMVPNGQLGEQQKVFGYDHGLDGQNRLVTSEIVSSGGLSYSTSYAYDEYDHIDTLTGANGLYTAFRNDAFGVTSWTTNADGTQTCTAKRWAQGHPLAPDNSSYYVWNRSSNGVQSLVFYHKTGAEMRSVTYGLRGEPIFTDRQYDRRGRLSAVSEPYREGETARWITYGYDNLDRLTAITTPDTTCTTTAYDGFRTETTVTTPQGLTQESAVTVNAMGWTVRSDNADGSYVTFDHYADGLMATATVNGNTSTMVTATYDDARRRTTLTDPDYGTLTTTYDAYGRLKRSISPRELSEQTGTENFYDGFDRLIRTAEGLGNTRTDYSYNETGVLKGALDSVVFKKQGGAFIQRVAYAYDSLARPVRTIEQRYGGTYTTTIDYDSQSRIRCLVHPTGVTVRYGYSHGYLCSVTDDGGRPLWKLNGMDAWGQPLEVGLGNGAVTSYAYDTLTHRLTGIVTTKNLQALTYDYDKFGNLASRKDNRKNLEETFTYDDMNRLTGITLKRPSGQDLQCSVTYDALGRMTSRQAVTSVNGIPQVTSVFSQPVFDATKVHAMASATTASGLFAEVQTATYTGFDKVSMVKQGKDSLCYAYGYDRQRILMEEHFDGAMRTKRYVGNCEFVTETEGNTTVEYSNTYLTGPYGVFAVAKRSGGFTETYYVLKDNLGSWTAITNETGIVKQELSYDAWGNLRNPDSWATYTVADLFDKPVFDRGFTGHEHLYDFGLINMNGRMYDPVVSSFLSADRFVQNPMSAQGFNRYAYCMNNPLRYVDPTGWLSGGGDFHPRVSAPRSPLSLIQDYLSDPCYFTRKQLIEAGIYDIEGGYGFSDGGGTMNANWMEGDGSIHSSSWSVQTEGGGFNAGAWAIPVSFNPMWENHCRGFCDYGSVIFENSRIGSGITTGDYFASVLNGSYYANTYHYSLEKKGVLPLDVDNNRGFGVSQWANYYMGYTIKVSNVFDSQKHSFSNDQICINVSGMSSHTLTSGDVFSSAKAFLYVDGSLIDSKPFVIDPQITVINSINVSYIGNAVFIVPSSGNIVLQIKGGWSVYTGTGWMVPGTTLWGPTINADKTIEINP